MTAYFTDAHCHLFNIEDVPFFATMRRKIKPVDTLGLFAASLGIMNVDRFRQFILFFEQPVQENLRELLEEIRGVVSEKPLLLTPLVMDFFGINPETKPVELQVRHLREGISRCAALSPDDRVLPFLGYDLRRLKKEPLSEFIAYWDRCGGVLPAHRRRSPELFRNGEVLGVKLYPPIGFNPDPLKERNGEVRARYEGFYLWCIHHQVPVTVHCQYASYSLYSGSRVRYYTHPLNWRRLLARPGFQNLRLNLAHVGGWEDMVAWQNTGKLPVSEEESGRAGYEPGTWAPVVVSLLKKYPAVYADLSAFNFASRPACRALKKLLERDERGDYGDGYPLRKKLLWGSDVPMVIPAQSYKEKGRPGYLHLFARFVRTVTECAIADPASAVTDITERNPRSFLFPFHNTVQS